MSDIARWATRASLDGFGTASEGHEYRPAPVYSHRAIYTQATCSCGWSEPSTAYATNREAKAAWVKHFTERSEQ